MFKKFKNLFSRGKKYPPQEKIYINVAKEFSVSPGGRYEHECIFSGERFRKTQLYPKLNEARLSGKKLVVNLDGAFGYATSFLDEAFGGLIREDGELLEEINKSLEIVSNEEPGLLEEIQDYMKEASNV